MSLQLLRHFGFSKLSSFYRTSIKLPHKGFCKVAPPTAVSLVKNLSEKFESVDKKMNSSVKVSDFIYPNDTPVIWLDCENAFNALNEKEKLYSHYFSRASWYGGLIVLFQTSPESPLIYILLHKVFRSQSIDELKNVATTECSFTEDEFKAFLMYASGVFSNMGNYKGFGDSKFIPNLSKDKFVKLILASKAGALQPKEIKSLLDRCADKIFSLGDKEIQLGFPEVGVTTYLSKSFTKEDADTVEAFMKKNNVGAYNTRAFKTIDETGSSCYEIKLASVATTEDLEEKDLVQNYTMNGHKFTVSRGDYSKLLKLVNKSLLQAKEYVANENQMKMIDNYVRSFQTGSIEAHKKGSTHWVKDIGPIVETYIGFIESYRDPAGTRGEFEGFVAVVNKPMSVKFANLVKDAEELLPLLPWPSEYEKDKFLRPDFTSLDVLTFSGSGIPAGICIPNYDELRQNVGFKNVSLGNVISSSYKSTKPNYVTEEVEALLEKYRTNAFELDVGLHELLGHGSGKLFKKEKGALNFDTEKVKHLETNQKLTSWYEESDTYDSVFGPLGSSYEECRAECVALHLSPVPHILQIFGFEGTVADDIIYVCWFGMCHAGLEGLQTYEPKSQKWLQAHSQARFVILQVILEAGENFVQIEERVGKDENPDLLLKMDRSKILSVGKPAIAKFLQRLQLYRSTADVASAKAMFDKYSQVSDKGIYPFLEYREIVMARKKPRKIFVEANTCIKGDAVVLKSYEATPEGQIQSWIERFQDAEELDSIIEEQWQKDQQYFS